MYLKKLTELNIIFGKNGLFTTISASIENIFDINMTIKENLPVVFFLKKLLKLCGFHSIVLLKLVFILYQFKII